jgi:hypothetical protein
LAFGISGFSVIRFRFDIIMATEFYKVQHKGRIKRIEF